MLVSGDSANSPNTQTIAPPVSTEQGLRAGAWSLLGALLYSAPPADLLDHLGSHNPEQESTDETGAALDNLAKAAKAADADSVTVEYQDLFIGVGRGELMPFGSWYQTGFMMEKPLGLLRDDLRELGFERQQDISEPEDHVAALCEVMAMLISDAKPHAVQQRFFDNHMSDWIGRFFDDLSKAETADFYHSVGGLGSAFVKLEQQYFAMKS